MSDKIVDLSAFRRKHERVVLIDELLEFYAKLDNGVEGADAVRNGLREYYKSLSDHELEILRKKMEEAKQNRLG